MPVAESASPVPQWVIRDRDREAELRLAKELGIPALVAGLLIQRGYRDAATAHAFLAPELDQLHDPKLLPDYEKARDILLAAKASGELIYVHGDYDVDGVTSAAIFHRFLNRIECKVHTHVPHRQKEGYGIHLDAVEDAIQLGAKIFLTCDCGITAHDQVARAREAGMKVVVTDHHEVGESLPNAHAVVNTHRKDSRYPFAELSGAGVAFKLCQGLAAELGHPAMGFHRAFLDLAALGTIADVMPLIGENRIIAKFGLERLRDTKKVGLKALMREANVGQDPDKPVTARHVGWHLGPRLNAVGRIEDAGKALLLLITADEQMSSELAHRLEQINQERRNRTQDIVREAEDMVLAAGLDGKSLIVVAAPDWHPGIVGIVAGRLVERFNRPCFVLTLDEKLGVYRGSARSIPKFHLAEAIWAHPELMTGGGHSMAAGCSFPAERLFEATAALEAYAGARLTEEDFRPAVSIDMEVSSPEITLAAAEALMKMEPFGLANPEPVFVARSVALCQIRPTRDPKHVRLTLRQGDAPPAPGIAFGIGEAVCELGAGAVVDLLFRPDVNEFRGNRELQWQVRDFRVS